MVVAPLPVPDSERCLPNGRKVRGSSFSYGDGESNRFTSGKRSPCGHLAPCGCDVASAIAGTPACCVQCPLTVCIDDMVQGYRTLRQHMRAEEAHRLRNLGFRSDDIAARIGVSERTTYRLLKIARETAVAKVKLNGSAA